MPSTVSDNISVLSNIKNTNSVNSRTQTQQTEPLTKFVLTVSSSNKEYEHAPITQPGLRNEFVLTGILSYACVSYCGQMYCTCKLLCGINTNIHV